MVPPPRRHVLTYWGVLSAHARDRSAVVPAGAEESCDCREQERGRAADAASPATAKEMQRRRRGLLWAELMRRTFGLDVLQCSCGGRMRLLCCVTDPDALAAIAKSLGRETPRSRPPPKKQEQFVEPA